MVAAPRRSSSPEPAEPVVSESFGTAGVGMRSRRAAPRSSPTPPAPAAAAPAVTLLAGMDQPRRHRGMAARRPVEGSASSKPFSLLMPPDMADWVSDFAHWGRVDRSEIHRELVHILIDCQDGLIANLPGGEDFADWMLGRIMERRRIANAAAASQASDRQG